MLAGSRLLTILWCVALAGSAALAAIQWIPVEPWVLGPVEVLMWIVICAGLFGLFTLAGVACVAGSVLMLRVCLKRTEPVRALRDCVGLAAASRARRWRATRPSACAASTNRECSRCWARRTARIG